MIELAKTRDDFERDFEAAKLASTGQLRISPSKVPV